MLIVKMSIWQRELRQADEKESVTTPERVAQMIIGLPGNDHLANETGRHIGSTRFLSRAKSETAKDSGGLAQTCGGLAIFLGVFAISGCGPEAARFWRRSGVLGLAGSPLPRTGGPLTRRQTRRKLEESVRDSIHT